MNSATEAIRAEKLVKTFGSVGEEGGRGAMATPSAPIHRRASGPGTERFVLPGCGAGSAPSREYTLKNALFSTGAASVGFLSPQGHPADGVTDCRPALDGQPIAPG